MIWALTKIIMSLILVVCFIFVIVAWILRAADKPKDGKEILKKVAITILLLWFSWVILRLINPNFFS
jgi:heme/copper-type cytochrome/quinol oxidase subunit 2